MRLVIALCVVIGHADGVAQAAPKWSLQEVARIGGADATGDAYVFADVQREGVAGRADGNVLVVDQQGKRILEYDRSGRHVRTLGRAGEGPGEFEFPTAITLGRGDSIFVLDRLRYTVFPPQGRNPRTFQLQARAYGTVRFAGGGFVQALSAVPSQTSGVGTFAPDRARLTLFSLDGRVRDTIWSGPVPRRELVTLRSGNSSFSTHATEQYGVNTYWDALRDGTLVISDTSAYLLRLVTPEGRQLRAFGTREPGRRLTDADRRRALDRIRTAQEQRRERRRNERLQTPPELDRQQLEQTRFAAVVPRITGVRVDAQDRIWVGVSGAAEDVQRIDVYDRNGRIVGVIDDPPGMPVALYGEGYAAFLERDEFDAQFLRIMRVR